MGELKRSLTKTDSLIQETSKRHQRSAFLQQRSNYTESTSSDFERAEKNLF